MARRHQFFGFMIFAIVAVILSGVTLISSSTNSKDIISINWANGSSCNSGGCFDFYMGVFSAVSVIHGGGFDSATFSANWNSESCQADFCKDCQDSMKAVLAFAILTLFLCLPGLYADFMRTREYGNIMYFKQLGIVTSMGAVYTCIVCLVAFSVGCEKKVEAGFGTKGMRWQYGPAFTMICAVLACKFVDLLGNMLIPIKDSVDKLPAAQVELSPNNAVADHITISARHIQQIASPTKSEKIRSPQRTIAYIANMV